MQKFSNISELNKISKIIFYKYDIKKIMFRHHWQYLEILLKCVRSAYLNAIKVLNIYLFLKIFQKVEIVMLR